MNRADPDCGTSFTWVTRAMGPQWGWITGWAIVVADVVVMATLAYIAGKYTFLCSTATAAHTLLAVSIVAAIWIALMTWICYVGIELSAPTQQILLSIEIIILGLFAIVALVQVYTAGHRRRRCIGLDWFSPFGLPGGQRLIDGVLLGVFIYWGWDSGVCVNEESRQHQWPRQGRRAEHDPARADLRGGRRLSAGVGGTELLSTTRTTF